MRLTLTAAVLASAVIVAIGHTATASSPAGTSITLHLTSQLEQAHYVDNPPPGPSAGDDLVFTERLLNTNGRQVGNDAASCIALFDQRSLCTGTYILPNGQILVQLLQPGETGTYTQAITGGTGKYQRATGTVTVAQHPGHGDHFTLNINLP
jgi:hypothetical protein